MPGGLKTSPPGRRESIRQRGMISAFEIWGLSAAHHAQRAPFPRHAVLANFQSESPRSTVMIGTVSESISARFNTARCGYGLEKSERCGRPATTLGRTVFLAAADDNRASSAAALINGSVESCASRAVACQSVVFQLLSRAAFCAARAAAPPTSFPKRRALARLQRRTRKRAELKLAQVKQWRATPARMAQEREAAQPGLKEPMRLRESGEYARLIFRHQDMRFFQNHLRCKHTSRETAVLSCVRVPGGRCHRGSARNSSRQKSRSATPVRRSLESYPPPSWRLRIAHLELSEFAGPN